VVKKLTKHDLPDKVDEQKKDKLPDKSDNSEKIKFLIDMNMLRMRINILSN
jgi:hypothetical protein